MNSTTQNNTDVMSGYEPPKVEDLGSIVEVTAGAAGADTDSCNTGAYTYSNYPGKA